MSEISSSSVWNDDGPTLVKPDPPTRSPPPIPAQKPVGIAENVAPKAPAHKAPTTVAPTVPVDDLIQFESEEERAATVPLNGNAYAHLQNQKIEKSQEEVMREFLKDEGVLSMQDYMRRFYQIRIEQDKFRTEPAFSSDCAIAPQHYARNRYRDILPYDHNRVEIEKDEENPDGYMNASFIQLPEGKTQFIAAQAPLPSTLDEWWKMIDEHEVVLIVILCKLIEQDKIKCERYWPENVNEIEIFGDYEVTLEEEKTFEDDEYLLRKLLMHNQTTGETKTVYQLHYREWPDHGCPSGESQLLNMIEEMTKLHQNVAPTTPILVHCSAGVGRTGTIIAVNHIREQMEAGTLRSIDVFGLVITLRRQRASMVQTQDQYQFVHKCIATYCRSRLGIEEPKPLNPQDLPLANTMMTNSVMLIAPPTPTTAGGQHETPRQNGDDADDDEATATRVPDFPDEPPAPLGPEDLSTSAAQ